jgi:pimeloyl-ACP methyl ester carboxylesterase
MSSDVQEASSWSIPSSWDPDVRPIVCDKARILPDVQLSYRVFGNPNATEKLFFISGFGALQTMFNPLIHRILMELPEWMVCTYDNRRKMDLQFESIFPQTNHVYLDVGESTGPIMRYTSSMLAQDALALLNHLGWTKVHVFAQALGGMIAQELALLAPDRIASMFLSCTHAGKWRFFARNLTQYGIYDICELTTNMFVHIRCLKSKVLGFDLLRDPAYTA